MRFLLAIFLLTYNTGLLAEPRTITWDDLSPPKEIGTKMALNKESAVKGITGESEFDGGKEELSMFLEAMNFMKSMQRVGGFVNLKFIENLSRKLLFFFSCASTAITGIAFVFFVIKEIMK